MGNAQGFGDVLKEMPLDVPAGTDPWKSYSEVRRPVISGEQEQAEFAAHLTVFTRSQIEQYEDAADAGQTLGSQLADEGTFKHGTSQSETGLTSVLTPEHWADGSEFDTKPRQTAEVAEGVLQRLQLEYTKFPEGTKFLINFQNGGGAMWEVQGANGPEYHPADVSAAELKAYALHFKSPMDWVD